MAVFYDQLLPRVAGLPEVRSAAVTSSVPSSFEGNPTEEVNIEGRPATNPGELHLADYQKVSADYFQTLRIPILQGRLFGAQDAADAPRVAIISQSMARRYWSDRQPIGARIRIGRPEFNAPWHTVVGVVGDVREPFDSEPQPTIFAPYRQAPRNKMSLVIRTSSAPMQLAKAARSQVSAVDRDVPFYDIKPMQQIIAEMISGVRLSAITMIVFGVVSLILAAAGIYAVMAYSVEKRTHEIGVRIALGAQRKDFLKLITGYAAKLAAAGIAVGLPAAFAVSRLMSAFLHGVITVDAATFVGFTLLLSAEALVACYVPARRATRVDPMVALRYE